MVKEEPGSEAEEGEETIYDEEGRKELVDDDEISGKEEGFMMGYDQAEEEGYKKKSKEEPEEEEGYKKKSKEEPEEEE